MHVAKAHLQSSLAIKFVDQFYFDNSVVCVFHSKSMEEDGVFRSSLGTEIFENEKPRQVSLDVEPESAPKLICNDQNQSNNTYGKCSQLSAVHVKNEFSVVDSKARASPEKKNVMFPNSVHQSTSESESNDSLEDITDDNSGGKDGHRRMRAVLTPEQVQLNCCTFQYAVSLKRL